MSAAALLLKFWPYILAAVAAAVGGWKLAAAEDRLEMDREATAAERKAAGMTDDEARAEAMKWSKH